MRQEEEEEEQEEEEEEDGTPQSGATKPPRGPKEATINDFL